jgi:small subunit ribosomal protein S2
MVKEDIKLETEEMAKAGLHFGHKTSKLHPKMLPYIFGARNNIHIIDLEKTKEKLKEALNFIQELIKEKKVILIVGTKIQLRELVKEFANQFNFPYINYRWLGGTFTNFNVIKKRVEYLKELEEKKEKGEFEKYTKKEKMILEKKFLKLKDKFEGIKNLEKLPDAVLILDMEKERLAVKEARKMGIKIIAISHTNVDPTLADFPIPANDDAISSVEYILDKIKEAILKVKKDETRENKKT